MRSPFYYLGYLWGWFVYNDFVEGQRQQSQDAILERHAVFERKYKEQHGRDPNQARAAPPPYHPPQPPTSPRDKAE